MEITCPICNSKAEKSTGHYNRAIKLGLNLYCSKPCASIGKKLQSDKHLKTPEQLKAEKAEYDKQRRISLADELKISRKQYYEANKETILPKMRVYNRSRMASHVIYCRQPSQRKKEKERRHKRLNQLVPKLCIGCDEVKPIIQFESFPVFPDRRNYICKECEAKQYAELGINTRSVLANIRTALIKCNSNLKIKDIAQYPYLIEANKYLFLLKRLTK